MSAVRLGALIAAGEGSRLARDGFAMAKPLVPIAGLPLVEYAVRNLEAAGVTRLAAIFNEREDECARYVREQFAHLSPEIVIKTTPSSLASFREVLSRLPEGRVLVSTVDAFCLPDQAAALGHRAEEIPEDATLLGVTNFVHDEKPLWVRFGDGGRISRIGGDAGDAVTAGFYSVPQNVRELKPLPSHDRLRAFLAWLSERGESLYAHSMGRVVDVDRAEDVALAEKMTKETTGAMKQKRAAAAAGGAK